MKKQNLNEQVSRIKEMMSKMVNENLYGASGWEGGSGDKGHVEPSNMGSIPQKPTYTEENKEAVDFLENLIKNHYKDLRYDAVERSGNIKTSKGFEFPLWSVSIFKVGSDGYYRDKETLPYFNLKLGIAYDEYTKSVIPTGIHIQVELENVGELDYTFEGSDPNVKYFGYDLVELNGTDLVDLIKENESYKPTDSDFDDNHDFDNDEQY